MTDNEDPRPFGQRTSTFSDQPLSQVVQRFIHEYGRTQDHYIRLASCAEALIAKQIKDQEGNEVERLEAKLASRAKEIDSLRLKLKVRDEKIGGYTNEDQVREDVVDLAGVRIILYKPTEYQSARAEEIIYQIWGKENVEKKAHNGSEGAAIAISAQDTIPAEKPKSYRRIHSGYKAMHYRARMLRKHDGIKDYHYHLNDIVEIQVVSAFAHALAEAGHDVLYKTTTSGAPRPEEERILDALSGIVQSVDLLLEQFHELVQARTYKKFTYLDELRRYLRDLDILEEANETDNPFGKGLDVLLQFLITIKKNYPIAVRDGIKELGYPKSSEYSLGVIMSSFRPRFEINKGMVATMSLMHVMLPQRGRVRDQHYQASEKCRIMINALTLLQECAEEPIDANDYLSEKVKLVGMERRSMNWVLGDPQRQTLLKEQTAQSQRELQQHIGPAWDWFQTQAEKPNSFCGFVFKVVTLGPAESIPVTHALHKLYFGPLARNIGL